MRVSEVLPVGATDRQVLGRAIGDGRTVLTQDLDFSAAIALSGKAFPSLITLRLSSSRVEHVNSVLQNTLPLVEQDVVDGTIVTVEDHRLRRRPLPIR